MAGIKVGDNGTVYEFLVRDAGAIVPLNGATVTIVIKPSGRDKFEKVANVTDATNGVCQITLTREDLATSGGYALQGIVKKDNGDEFASDVEKFSVGGRI
ncbi:BppU family phage baseplate upper protein [Neobacillus niacini]|uniref:BppU family phage baseplate upper protein n=1 Tax=Neobacillus niacini TaxID=86668 RepID=UPI002854F67F|nr:BppU family phage baseplate upper protein [Neobacillus niacini]MDR7001540.1 energy-converting hydrogenase Eha subunit E [Neobacillus niacini]